MPGYLRMMKIVLDAGFHAYVGIEWEGGHPDEMEGIRLTKRLLRRVLDNGLWGHDFFRIGLPPF